MKIRHSFLTAGIGVLAPIILAVPAHGTPAEGDVVRTDLAKGDTNAPVSIVTGGAPTTLIVQALTLKPSASSGWHTHPGPEYSVVNSGVVDLQTAADCAVHEFGAGQAVFIPAGIAHRVVNDSGEDADVVVTYTVPVDAALRGDVAAACPG